MVKFFKTTYPDPYYYAVDNGYYIPLNKGFLEFALTPANRVFYFLNPNEEWCDIEEVKRSTNLAPWAKKYLYRVKRHVVEGKLP